ncbi:MAG TPA: DUF1080 domain-containing protein [Vicinamibacterales bacterium]|nr:DUF1080 domain-containing protein [Vicinamibacterales bacterium]
MARSLVLTLAAWSVLVSGAVARPQTQQPAPVEPGWTSLFNGTDFTGWRISGSQATFTIQDGAMVANGRVAHAFYDGPFKDHSFREFELKVDVMTRAGSNGGVYVLTEYQEGGNARASGVFPSKGFEIQVNNSHSDRIRSGSLYHVKDILDQSPAKDDEWFTEHIIVKGDTITVNVNGVQVVQWTQTPDWNGGPEGPGRRITGPGTIALQGHDPRSTVYYKNIRVK